MIVQSSLSAHTVILKDLKVLYGIVASIDGQFITLNSDKGPKKIRKDLVGKIIIQEVKDETALKKFLKKVKEANPGYVVATGTGKGNQNYIDFGNGTVKDNRTWRLPSKDELLSIGNYNTTDFFDPVYFPKTATDIYWSSTPYAINSVNAWAVFFHNGHVNNLAKTNTYFVRCVSGP